MCEPAPAMRGDRQVQRRLAARGGDRADAAFERGDALLEHGVGRVRDPAVDVARALHVEERGGVLARLEDERRRQVDRHRARAGRRVGRGAGVQRQRVEAGIRRSRACGILRLWRTIVGYIDRTRHSGGPSQDRLVHRQLSGDDHESQRHPARQGRHAVHRRARRAAARRRSTSCPQHDIGSLVVMDHGELVGMLTFREVIQAVVNNGGALGDTRVRSVMDDAPLTCTPDDRARRGAPHDARPPCPLHAGAERDAR